MAGPLPSWNEGATKSAILDFVARDTKQGGPEFVLPAERIAAFDNDGTPWCEQPFQVQVFFLIDRVKGLAGKDPAMKERQPFKALLEHDHKTLRELGKQGGAERRPQIVRRLKGQDPWRNHRRPRSRTSSSSGATISASGT